MQRGARVSRPEAQAVQRVNAIVAITLDEVVSSIFVERVGFADQEPG